MRQRFPIFAVYLNWSKQWAFNLKCHKPGGSFGCHLVPFLRGHSTSQEEPQTDFFIVDVAKQWPVLDQGPQMCFVWLTWRVLKFWMFPAFKNKKSYIKIQISSLFWKSDLAPVGLPSCVSACKCWLSVSHAGRGPGSGSSQACSAFCEHSNPRPSVPVWDLQCFRWGFKFLVWGLEKDLCLSLLICKMNGDSKLVGCVLMLLFPLNLSVSFCFLVWTCGNQTLISLDPAAEQKAPGEPRWHRSLEADFIVC